MKLFDGLQNLVTGLGSVRDKGSHSNWVMPVYNPQQLSTMYRASGLARKIVDAPAEDATREWREWVADADQISALEKEERRLQLQRKVRDGLRAGRLSGGVGLYMHIKDGADPLEPVNLQRIKKGGLQQVSLISRAHLSAGEIEWNPEEALFGRPKTWRMGGADGQPLEIHPSRLVILKGNDVPDDVLAQDLGGWGDSVLSGILDELRRLDNTAANIAALVFESKIDVVRIPDLMMNLTGKSKEYEETLIKRWTLAAQAKSVNSILLMDKEEEYEQKNASFAQLPEVAQVFMQLLSAVADIPMTRLFGMSPAGLNATGESDLRNYYDSLKTFQTTDLDGELEYLNEALIRSALGSRPEEVHYNWRPLWQPTAKEKAEIAGKTAETLDKVHKTGLVPDEVMADVLVNTMTEVGAMPGLEQSMREYFEANPDALEEEPEDEDETLNAALIEEPEQQPVGDAAPRTLYVHRKVLNAGEILDWAKEQGFETTLPADDLHVTIAFSRRPVDWMKIAESYEPEVEVRAGGPRVMEEFGEAKVLLFRSGSLEWRHEEFKEAGASWDHPEYQPHITISYGKAPENVEPYQGRIVLGPEVFAEVNEDWKAGVNEVSA